MKIRSSPFHLKRTQKTPRLKRPSAPTEMALLTNRLGSISLLRSVLRRGDPGDILNY